MLRVILLTGLAMLASAPGLAFQADAGQGKPEDEAFTSGLPVPPGAVAVMNGKTVDIRRYVDALYRRFRGHPKGVEALENLIQKRIVDLEMEKRGLTITQKDLKDEFARLDATVVAQSQGKSSIEAELEQAGRTMDEFMATLRYPLAMRRMAQADFGRKEISPADQAQWLRSKTIDAQVQREPESLPPNTAAKVHESFVTREEFARALIELLPDRDVVTLARSMMQADLARELCAERRITLTDADYDAEYARAKRLFEENPKYQGLKFEVLLEERMGMTPEVYRSSPGFLREVCLSRLGEALVPDATLAQAFDEDMSHYGPVYDLRHILIRGSDDPKRRAEMRAKSDAKTQIETLLARIKRGDESFAEAVKLYSEDAKSKFREGKLGSYTPKQAESFPALSQALATMKVGELRGPIESSYGYHIIELHAKKPAPPLSPAIAQEVRKRRASRLFGQAWRDAKRGLDLTNLTGR